MSASDPSDPDIVDPLTDDPLAFLYEAGEEDEDEDSTADHPGYGSLMGLAVRRDGPGARPAKAKVMAIVLDELEAQRAAEVMEINAGQLMTNPDRSGRQVGFQGLGLDASDEGEDEGDLAESLNWDAPGDGPEDDDAGWQPENPLAGTGIAEDSEDDDDGWQPENPLAGTGIVQDDEDDWQPVNPLAGTEFEHAESEAAEWGEPLPPAAGEPGFEDEQAWSGHTAAVSEPDYREVEWEAPAAEAQPEPERATNEVAGSDFAVEPPLETAASEDPAMDEPAPVDWQIPPHSAGPSAPVPSAPIAWQSLLAKRPPKKQVDLTPIDWQELPEEAPFAEAPREPAPPADDGWPDSGEEPFELPPEPPPPWHNFAAGDADEQAAETPAPADAFDETFETGAPEEAGQTVEAAEAEWQGFATEEPAEPYTSEWPEFAAEESGEPGKHTLAAEPEQIEVLHFPAAPAAAPQAEVPHHRLRAMVLKGHQPRPRPSSKLKPAAKWLWARFNGVAVPLLKRLWAWATAKWAEIAARSRRD